MTNNTTLFAAMPRKLTPLALALVLAGCASFSQDGGLSRVSELTRERTGQPVVPQRSAAAADTARGRVAELLKAPLTPDSAVEIALLNNPGLQAQLAELGIAEADAVRAGRLPNPVFSFGRLAGGGETEIDRAVLFNVLGLLSLPATARVGRERFELAQYQAADAAVGLAAEARRAYFDAVASQELLQYYGQVKESAELAGELARRMQKAGNFSKLAQMREQAFHADAVTQYARAQHQALADREKLTRVLGLDGRATFQLPDRLPDLPKQPAAPQQAEQAAMEKRLDVLIARRQAEATARSLGLTKATRFINVLEAGYQNKSATGSPRATGYEIQLELPLFDFGTASTARAEATYMQAVHRAAEVAVSARSEVRESYSAYRTAYDVARHYRDEVVPLRKSISEENMLRYNGMLIGVFELLADAREQIGSVMQALDAQRDFWLADAALQAALIGQPAKEQQP